MDVGEPLGGRGCSGLKLNMRLCRWRKNGFEKYRGSQVSGVELIGHSAVECATLVSSRGWFGSLRASPSGMRRVMRGLSGAPAEV